jgi:hypothetical protein
MAWHKHTCGKYKIPSKFWFENLNGRDHYEDLGFLCCELRESRCDDMNRIKPVEVMVQ